MPAPDATRQAAIDAAERYALQHRWDIHPRQDTSSSLNGLVDAILAAVENRVISDLPPCPCRGRAIVHVDVSRTVHARLAGRWSDPVQILLTEPDETGLAELKVRAPSDDPAIADDPERVR